MELSVEVSKILMVHSKSLMMPRCGHLWSQTLDVKSNNQLPDFVGAPEERRRTEPCASPHAMSAQKIYRDMSNQGLIDNYLIVSTSLSLSSFTLFYQVLQSSDLRLNLCDSLVC